MLDKPKRLVYIGHQNLTRFWSIQTPMMTKMDIEVREVDVKDLPDIENFAPYPTERWARVIGFGRYLISDHGRVISLPNGGRRARLLTPAFVRSRYPTCSLMGDDGRRTNVLVTHLVARHFILDGEPVPANQRVWVRDNNPRNLHVSNLVVSAACPRPDTSPNGTPRVLNEHARVAVTRLHVERGYTLALLSQITGLTRQTLAKAISEEQRGNTAQPTAPVSPTAPVRQTGAAA